ncbi:hypothetical protein EI94DRAFT_1906871 [Lactarius quietus]|nr:hypothetical protein EI94DRAFT_1906871 [Lactarius quietus]
MSSTPLKLLKQGLQGFQSFSQKIKQRKDEQCVMDAIEARENVEKNGGDDMDEDSPVKPCLGRHEALKAISTITQYVSELDNPYCTQN